MKFNQKKVGVFLIKTIGDKKKKKVISYKKLNPVLMILLVRRKYIPLLTHLKNKVLQDQRQI